DHKFTVNGKAAYELKGRLLDDLCKNAFSGTNGEDAVEHIEYFLKIVNPIDLPNVNHERLRLAVFPISLVGNASKWFDEFKGLITTWVDLTNNFFWKYYPPSRTCNVVGTRAKRDPTNTMFEKWLASKFANHMMMDPFTKNALFDFWKKVDNQEVLTNEGFSDLEKANNNDEHKIAKIFMIETNLFDYETPGGELLGMVRVGYMTYFQDYEWYDDLTDRSLKEEALKQKAIYEKSWGDATQRMVEHATTLIFKKRRNNTNRDDEEEYVAIKEYEYDDLTRTNEDACHAYQEIFCNVDEGWLVTSAD
ncbi:hypothetical protein Tco_1163597, partial [Tanacetum coccineum]